MKPQRRAGLVRQAPPAVFPPILGLIGLGLAWRQAAAVFAVPSWIGEMILGAVTLIYLLALLAYLAKVLRAPASFAADLRILPGRAGLAAGSAAAMLLAAVLVPYGTGLARTWLILAVALHAVVAIAALRALSLAPFEQRRMNPVWQLTFVGFIIAPVAAIPLGAIGISQIILIVTLPLAVVIWIGHFIVTRDQRVPAPLRPLLAIHLAPICLFGLTFGLLDLIGFAALFGWLAILVLAAFLLRAGYMLRADFSPFWGAYTFPMAAFCNLMLLLAIHGEPFHILGGIGLIAASFAIVAIAYRILKLWIFGKLGPLTNAARI